MSKLNETSDYMTQLTKLLFTQTTYTTRHTKSTTDNMALVVVKNPTTAEHCRKLLFVPNGDHVTDIDAAFDVSPLSNSTVVDVCVSAITGSFACRSRTVTSLLSLGSSHLETQSNPIQ